MAPIDPAHLTLRDALQILATVVSIEFGVTPVRIRIDTNEDQRPITLPLKVKIHPSVPAESGIALPSCAEEDEQQKQSNLKVQVITSVIRILQDVRQNLTAPRLLSELASRGIEVSDRSLNGWLASMVDDGTLYNERSKKPRGYGLPEWESTSD